MVVGLEIFILKIHRKRWIEKNSTQTHVHNVKYVCIDQRKDYTKGGQRVYRHSRQLGMAYTFREISMVSLSAPNLTTLQDLWI